MNKKTAFLLAIVRIKANLKLAYAVYCTISSNIIKYMSFEYAYTFVLYYVNIESIHLISVTLLQNDQNEEHIQKDQT